MHDRPVPRTGGLGILIGLAAGWVTAATWIHLPDGWLWVLAGLLPLAVVSMLDDWQGLPVMPRLAVHAFAAAALLGAGLGLEEVVLPWQAWLLPPALGAILAVLFTVWMLNLYNFMDGMDGLAGGMALIGFASLSLLGFLGGDAAFGLTTLTVALASGGFLVFNLPPARIFMGDTGASVLGFLAAACILWAEQTGLFPFWAGVLVFSPFIADATGTLVARLLVRERFWEAHRTHVYQVLARSRWGHWRTLMFEYALMLLAGASAVIAVQWVSAESQTGILSAWLLVYVLILGVFWSSKAQNEEKS
jgi:UDP-N-acetylmuramyl pentapeptide phosphotransferase/UDP-N-acetylglucosamine-1-phosphate transferase